jgi:peptidyl-prolyl cis-trans isomerase C
MILKPARLLVLLIATAALPVMAQNLAVVNGKPIPMSLSDGFIKQLEAKGQKDSPELRDKVKEHLVELEVLAQEADKLGLAKDPEVKTQIAYTREQILSNALMQDYVKKNPIKDADARAEYDKLKAQAPAKEYHARHILVDSEDEAKAIIVKLKGGAKFEDLAKEKSKDPTAPSGGDLDWGSNYEKPFYDAMVALKKGQFTETPVKTKYGFHIIKLEDTRDVKIPTFEEVKNNVIQQMQQKQVMEYRAALRAKAKVQP